LVKAGEYDEADGQDNILIRGENLYALKTLVKSGYAGQIGKQWEYKLIPHDSIFQTDSFDGVLGKAFVYKEQ
jgi:hypothetical protein